MRAQLYLVGSFFEGERRGGVGTLTLDWNNLSYGSTEWPTISSETLRRSHLERPLDERLWTVFRREIIRSFLTSVLPQSETMFSCVSPTTPHLTLLKTGDSRRQVTSHSRTETSSTFVTSTVRRLVIQYTDGTWRFQLGSSSILTKSSDHDLFRWVSVRILGRSIRVLLVLRSRKKIMLQRGCEKWLFRSHGRSFVFCKVSGWF